MILQSCRRIIEAFEQAAHMPKRQFLILIALVLCGCSGGRDSVAHTLTLAEPAFRERASIPHPDDPCERQPDPARWADAGVPDIGAQPPLISAHRGAHFLAPENTLWAYRHAFAWGADVVEIDVRESLDGVLFSLHDGTVDRTTDGSGEAALMLWSELQALNAADFEPWRGGPYDPARIPRLEEIFALAAEVGGGVELDMKFVRNYAALVLMLEEYGLVETSYYAADGAGADGIRVVQPRARFIYNASGEETPQQLYEQTRQSSIFGSRLDKFSAEKIAAIHDGCMLVLPHSYDEGADAEGAQWDEGRARGIDGAQSDQPDVIRARQAALDPARRLPTRLQPGGHALEVCLVNANNGLGLPYQWLELADASVVQTGIDGCVALPATTADSRPGFAGGPALQPTQWPAN